MVFSNAFHSAWSVFRRSSVFGPPNLPTPDDSKVQKSSHDCTVASDSTCSTPFSVCIVISFSSLLIVTEESLLYPATRRSIASLTFCISSRYDAFVFLNSFCISMMSQVSLLRLSRPVCVSRIRVRRFCALVRTPCLTAIREHISNVERERKERGTRIFNGSLTCLRFFVPERISADAPYDNSGSCGCSAATRDFF
ncbi:unnamed protein product [Haemonchus placei]|uniref:Transmembrane protein n=1 Tax=Haemonchus placei TaxID=6290 RepID=A0A0N4W5B9_HAEPC|nr:unnamed protein product [Haemonchus placei]